MAIDWKISWKWVTTRRLINATGFALICFGFLFLVYLRFPSKDFLGDLIGWLYTYYPSLPAPMGFLLMLIGVYLLTRKERAKSRG